MEMIMKFEPTGNGNEVLSGKGFFISYNSNPGEGLSMFQGDGGSDETALVNYNDPDNEYRILNGDFREEYQAIIDQGFEVCLELYNKFNDTHGSSWSTEKASEA